MSDLDTLGFDTPGFDHTNGYMPTGELSDDYSKLFDADNGIDPWELSIDYGSDLSNLPAYVTVNLQSRHESDGTLITGQYQDAWYREFQKAVVMVNHNPDQCRITYTIPTGYKIQLYTMVNGVLTTGNTAFTGATVFILHANTSMVWKKSLI